MQEVHFGGQYQSAADYYIGLDTERDFRVEAREGPSRLVLDIAQ